MPFSFGEVFSALEFVDISYPYLDLDVRQFIYSMSSIVIDSGVRMVYGGWDVVSKGPVVGLFLLGTCMLEGD